jgi:N-acetylglucosamine kinase-like BadF-type ATPase
MAKTDTPEIYLGVDGGGTKTEFVLIDGCGEVRARHRGASGYYLQVGLDGLGAVLREGVAAVLAEAGLSPDAVRYAFLGLPAYGEDSVVQPKLDALPAAVLGHRRYLCGNDMVCGWAGSLAGEDGINIVAGTGSIGYSERCGAKARSGGWGELFGDEGSAYWVAVLGLNAFSRMSDGRLPPGPLYDVFRAHFALAVDLDLCGRVMGEGASLRNQVAALSRLVSLAADRGDAEALRIFDRAGEELAAIVDAVRRRLGYETDETVRVSYSGGIFGSGKTLLEPLRRHLAERFGRYRLVEPLLSPGLGAALYAARAAGKPLDATAVRRLATQKRSVPPAV